MDEMSTHSDGGLSPDSTSLCVSHLLSITATFNSLFWFSSSQLYYHSQCSNYLAITERKRNAVKTHCTLPTANRQNQQPAGECSAAIVTDISHRSQKQS